jgi:negative regulator of flagellin synthesis FlgM
MVSTIGRNQPAGIKAYTSQKTSRFRRNGSVSGNKSASGSCEDRVLLSPMAKDIQMAKSQLQAIPDVRAEKVTEIKNQISQGTYPVSSEKIAHRLMGESLLNELL